MEEAAAVRRAATEAVGDVVPDALRSQIESLLADGSMAPGALTLLAATAPSDGPAEFAALDGLTERAAGVQLIYDGLRLTRDLAHADPWATGDRDRGDMGILAADVLVARGFYLLARTEAADRAVAVVRAFGRDQTHRRETVDPSYDRNLERDVLDLALVAGTTAAGGDAPAERDWLLDQLTDDGKPGERASSDVESDGDLPPVAELDGETLRADLRRLTGGEGRPVERSGD
ncbi:hypothetical protein BRC89_09160 [Halobacteriales archaeon QS_4_70_19]|nr:MAG: hypothetical protein BRC89_09160 [Halobacteriales archaeon QS_4_70_19]